MRKPNFTPPPKGVRVQQSGATGNSAAEIMAKHVRGPNRLLPPGNPAASEQLTFQRVRSESFHEMLNIVSGIRTKFETLPHSLRARFQNKPENMLDFMDDPKNRKECVTYGLVPMTDAEYQELSSEAEKKRLEAFAAVLRPDPEAQPNYGRRASPGASDPPQKGGSE